MTVVIKKGVDKKEFEKILDSFRENKKSKGVDTSKYCGTIKLFKDLLIIQKEIKDEWSSNYSQLPVSNSQLLTSNLFYA